MAPGMNTPSTRPVLRSTAQRRARGSIIINTAIALSLIVITLVGAELGYLFYLKRELQKTADLAALAGAQKLPPPGGTARCDSPGGPEAAADANAKKNYKDIVLTEAKCGHWDPAKNTPVNSDCFAGTDDHFSLGTSPENAFRVRIKKTPSTLLPFFTGNRTICVQAVATQQHPLALLTIRSALLNIDSSKSDLLNPVFGNLLGGAVTLDAIGWQGLINTQINLLSFLDAIAPVVGLQIGQYDQVLNSNVTAGELLQALASVLKKNGALVDASAAIDGMAVLSAEISNVKLSVADILGISTGTPSSALDLNLQAFQLTQAFVQLANSQHAAAVSAPSNLLGLANILTTIKIIEPPQMSAIGNPELAIQDPVNNGINVRTAQVRTLISIDFTTALNDSLALVNAVLNLTQPITDLLQDLLHLNLGGALSNILCAVLGCDRTAAVTDLRLLPSPFRIDINVEVAAGQARIDKYSCSATGNKSLDVIVDTSAVNLRIGKIGESAADAIEKAFANKLPPKVEPIPLVDIGSMTVRTKCSLLSGLFGCVTLWKKGDTWIEQKNQADRQAFAGGGIGLMTDTPILGSSGSPIFEAPVDANLPDISASQIPTPFQPVVAKDIVASLSKTLAQLDIHMYKPTVKSALGDLLVGVGDTIDGVVALIRPLIFKALSPILDPLVNKLLTALGIDLAKTEVGARLTCQGGAQLVY